MTFEELSPRDKQIVELLALGFTNPEIAEDLGATISAIKHCVHRLCLDVGAERRMRLILHFYTLHPKAEITNGTKVPCPQIPARLLMAHGEYRGLALEQRRAAHKNGTRTNQE